MKNEEFESVKFIYPKGDFRCWQCGIMKENLEVFAETEKEVCLICAECFDREVFWLEQGAFDF